MTQIIFWRKIDNFNYEVSSEGYVKNINREKHLPYATKGIFLTVELQNKKGSKSRRVDELVAENFIRRRRLGEIIEHIDGDPKNNDEYNLRWVKVEDYLSSIDGARWKLIDDKNIRGKYYISSKGGVWSMSSEIFLSKRIHASYPAVSVSWPVVQFRHVHILVAKAFVHNPNPELFDTVNHIDENISNYSFDNLEWCTNQYNTIYSLKRSGRSSPRENKKVDAAEGGVEFSKGYLVYRNGKVYSINSGIYLLMSPNGSGYPRVEIESKKRIVHLIVGKTFLEPPPDDGNRYEIDHINGNKTDNRVENLEWVTKSEQMKRCVKMHSKSYLKSQKAVVQLTLDDEIIKTFPGIKDAARKTNTNSGSITKACKGVRPSAGGFHWKYKLEISP